MSMVFDAVLFDCDGVLVDSEPITNGVLRQMLNEAGWALSQAETSSTGLSCRPVAHAAGYRYGHTTPRRTDHSLAGQGGEIPKWTWHAEVRPESPKGPSSSPASTLVPTSRPGRIEAKCAR